MALDPENAFHLRKTSREDDASVLAKPGCEIHKHESKQAGRVGLCRPPAPAVGSALWRQKHGAEQLHRNSSHSFPLAATRSPPCVPGRNRASGTRPPRSEAGHWAPRVSPPPVLTQGSVDDALEPTEGSLLHRGWRKTFQSNASVFVVEQPSNAWEDSPAIWF